MSALWMLGQSQKIRLSTTVVNKDGTICSDSENYVLQPSAKESERDLSKPVHAAPNQDV